MSKKILFISHEASRTGAPILLLHLIRWLRANTELTWEVVFKTGGELLPEFEALSSVVVWDEKPVLWPDPTPLRRFKARVKRRLSKTPMNLDEQWKNEWMTDRINQITGRGADLIYSNTLTNGDVLEALSALQSPVVCHAHELEYVIWSMDRHTAQPSNLFELNLRHTDHYIAASRAVKDNLIRNHAVAPDSIDVVHEFVPMPEFDADQRARARRTVREELGIAPDDALILGAGTVEWRKGSDLWVQVAAIVTRRVPSCHFVWVGGAATPDMGFRTQYDVDAMGLGERVRFIGARPNLLDYFAAADVFAMTSREDPYPLVNLEAASTGLPIVCFEGGGGTPELVEDDSGFVAPYLDVAAMAARIVELIEVPALRQNMGARAADKVRQRHDVSCAAPQILAVIERCLSP